MVILAKLFAKMTILENDQNWAKFLKSIKTTLKIRIPAAVKVPAFKKAKNVDF